jgi:hypothetical protein
MSCELTVLFSFLCLWQKPESWRLACQTIVGNKENSGKACFINPTPFALNSERVVDTGPILFHHKLNYYAKLNWAHLCAVTHHFFFKGAMHNAQFFYEVLDHLHCYVFRLWSNGCPSGRNDCAAPHYSMYWESDSMWSSSCIWLNVMHCALVKRKYCLITALVISSLIRTLQVWASAHKYIAVEFMCSTC